MTTARIQIALTINENVNLSVQRKPKRQDLERAVLSAQQWLLSLQFHKAYFGSAFTHYHVWQETETGQWIEAAKGVVEDAEKGRQLARTRASQEGNSEGSGTRKRARGSTARSKGARANVATGTAFASGWTATRAQQKRPESPAKAKFREALERAQQALQEKRNGGKQ